MEIALVVEDAAREDVEVERPANVLALVRAPFEGREADLEGEKRADSLAVSRILISETVELVRLVIEGDLRSAELRINCNKVTCRD